MVEIICTDCGQSFNQKITDLVKEYKIPFVCTVCGQIKFPAQPMRNLVFLWPKPVPDKIGSIILPDSVKKSMEDEFGVVLAAGKGYYTEAGEWKPCTLKTGDVVIYDKNVPWKLTITGIDVKYMSTVDIKGVLK